MTTGTGFFGKTPLTGDFVARNIDSPKRQALDRWITANLVKYAAPWPGGGLRGLIDLNQDLTLIVAVSSRDLPGRTFPLAAITDGTGVSFEVAETWCDAVAGQLERAALGDLSLDDLTQILGTILIHDRSAPDGFPALWIAGGDPVTCDEDGLQSLLSSDRSCFP